MPCTLARVKHLAVLSLVLAVVSGPAFYVARVKHLDVLSFVLAVVSDHAFPLGDAGYGIGPCLVRGVCEAS